MRGLARRPGHRRTLRPARIVPPDMVVGAGVMTRIVNPAGKKTYPPLGDGAGAVLIEAGSDDLDSIVFIRPTSGSSTRPPRSPAWRRKLVVDVDRFGNTSAESIQHAMDETLAASRIEPGDRVLLGGFGGGLAWGAALMKW